MSRRWRKRESKEQSERAGERNEIVRLRVQKIPPVFGASATLKQLQKNENKVWDEREGRRIETSAKKIEKEKVKEKRE